MDFAARLQALKDDGVIGAFVEPHENYGVAKGLTPWVIIPSDLGPATPFPDEQMLAEAIEDIETRGPMHRTPWTAWVPRSELNGAACPV